MRTSPKMSWTTSSLRWVGDDDGDGDDDDDDDGDGDDDDD